MRPYHKCVAAALPVSLPQFGWLELAGAPGAHLNLTSFATLQNPRPSRLQASI